jgi:DNA ligase 1
MSAYWIDKLNESDSRLHKEDVIRQALELATLGHSGSKWFLYFAQQTYNPYVNFYLRQVPTTEGLTDCENDWDSFKTLLSNLHSRRITGNEARDAVEAMSKRFDSDEWNNFCRNVIRKDLRSGISEKTINKIVKKTEYEIPIFGCQLATNSEGRPEMNGTKRLEPKLDGVRVLMRVTPDSVGQGASAVCFSRNGKIFENFGHIEQQIADKFYRLAASCKNRSLDGGFYFDGEVTGQTFQELMRQARRKEDVNATDSVFNIFDIIPVLDFHNGHYNAQLSKRIEMLEGMRVIIDQLPNVELLPHLMVDLGTSDGKDVLRRYANDMVSAGFEGIMIKNVDAPYECKRNTFWMKYKPVYDYDLTVIGIEEGTGKNVGRMGALVCEGVDDGKHITVNVGSGYTDEERQSYWDDKDSVIGQTVVVMADAITQDASGNYSLRFPRFKCFRDDK